MLQKKTDQQGIGDVSENGVMTRSDIRFLKLSTWANPKPIPFEQERHWMA
jgi:hypothetical protein